MSDAISLVDFTYAFADKITEAALPDMASGSRDAWIIYDWLKDMRRAAEGDEASEVAHIAQTITEKLAAMHG